MRFRKATFVIFFLATAQLFAITAAATVPVEISVILDGKKLSFDVPPQNINGRILVPLRAIFEEMGAKVDWDPGARTATAVKGDTVVTLTIGSTNPTVNGKVVEIDQPGIIAEDRTLAPLRFVAEAFGGSVIWDGPTNTANITLNGESASSEQKTLLLYQGHGSFRITAKDGTVIYVDPYAGEGYDKPADLILVTHQHGDHNQINLVTKKTDCEIITNVEALEGGKHNTFDIKGVTIEAVAASNGNHDSKVCVGYIITVDGIKIYAAGDTSKTGDMAAFAARNLDYALLPCDGIYNMGLAEAAECAGIIKAKYTIPVHMKPGELFDRESAEKFDAPNKLIVEAGTEITL